MLQRPTGIKTIMCSVCGSGYVEYDYMQQLDMSDQKLDIRWESTTVYCTKGNDHMVALDG